MKYLVLVILVLTGCSSDFYRKEEMKSDYQIGCLNAFVYVYKNEMTPTEKQRLHAIKYCNIESDKYANLFN